MAVLSAGQPSLASFEVRGQFCPNLRKDRKSLKKIIQFLHLLQKSAVGYRRETKMSILCSDSYGLR